MYNPRHFELDDLATQHALIRAHPFALLITPHEGEVHLSHLPVHLDATRGERGTLEAHLARPNPHNAALMAGAPSIVIFRGPDAYVSPRWYTDPTKSVPTWNYVAIHAHGKPVVYTDPATILRVIGGLTDEHEAYIENPWSVREAEAHVTATAKGIVAFEIPIERIEGKLKLSQNRIPQDRARVMQELRREPAHAEMVKLMEALYTGDGEKR